MESTRLHRGDGIFDIAVSGHHDDLGLGQLLLQHSDQLETVHPRQRIIGKHHVRIEDRQAFQRRLGAMLNLYLVALSLKVTLYVAGQQLIVLNYKNTLLHCPLPMPPGITA